MNFILEHLPVILTAKKISNNNAVLQRNITKLRHEHVDKTHVFIGMGSCGIIAGAKKCKDALINHSKKLDIEVNFVDVGCIGLCSEEPIIDIQIPGRPRISFTNVTPELSIEIFDAIVNNFIPDLPVLGQYPYDKLTLWEDVPLINENIFFKEQKKTITKRCGIIAPESIDEYIAHNGYKGFINAISNYTSKEVCSLIIDSELKGRSGSAYPTGEKWLRVNEKTSTQKYFICNADESDPGAFVDRFLIEGDPHQIIEGISIGAYATQCSKAIIYIRNRYHLAIERIKKAIKDAKAYGLLGENIFNSGFNLNIIISVGPGALVCGEETALISCIEGKRGIPRPKPPYPVESGLFDYPTVVNNCETLANIPFILRKGANKFKEIGLEQTFGTKLFSVSGKIAKTGVVEFELGSSIRDIIQTCGGILKNKELKAVHIGGPTGGFLPEEELDTKLEFSNLEDKGLRMGSGSFLVIDNENCIVSIAKYFMKVIQKESCGKCIPCREGSQRMLEILEKISHKIYNETGYEALERFKGVLQLNSLSQVMRDTSLCGLGQHAPNTIDSALRYFKNEFEEHIFERKCRAGVCKGLKTFIIDVDICNGCTLCSKRCPADAIIGTAHNPYFIVQEKCIGCGECYQQCKFNAITIK